MSRMPEPDARATALFALEAYEKSGAWTDAYLAEAIRRNGLDGRSAALASRLTAGVLQNRTLLDFYLARFSSMPLKKMDRGVLCILRLGAYQLCFLDRIPAHAVVNEAVKQVRTYAAPRAAGMVNAILRAMIRGPLPEIEGKTPEERLALRYSHPLWLVRELYERIGEDGTEAFLSADNQPAALCAQVNTLKTDTPALRSALEAEGVTVSAHPILTDALYLEHTGPLERLTAWREGGFYIQDAAARLSVTAAQPEPGFRVLDACAAPGGKSLAAAIAMKNEGIVTSCDIHPKKLARIVPSANRLGITCIQTEQADGREFRPEWEAAFDLVLADVPCSGLGTIRKKPEIRYKDPAQLESLPEIQAALLDNLSRYVCPGGVLLYSTCTVLERENEAVVNEFLRRDPAFCQEPFDLPEPIGRAEAGMLTFWPHLHGTDGFFAAKLRRRP